MLQLELRAFGFLWAKQGKFLEERSITLGF
ncbi:hypothetical protein Q644_06380 [Brucella intermedia 229E]|uniref:Uncharacterized protein n=1 Tax=Brucella intermedia 229E TaxID=1337887 RepID=U4VBN4_9HYPH|nr:hypothetical protein Q644_06380 [Brucella intermedia 229E]